MSELIGGWVAGLTATLIREGINKHRAREIAQGYWEAYCKDDEEVERLRALALRWLRKWQLDMDPTPGMLDETHALIDAA